MLFGLCAGFVVFQNDLGGLIRVLFGVFPTGHRSADETGQLVDLGGIGQLVLQHIETVLKRRDALILVFEGNQIIRRNARIHNLPVFVIGHGRDTIGLFLQQRINVKALFQDLNTGLAALGRNAQLRHPAEERVFVAKEPNAQRATREILGAGDAGFLETGQHHARAFEGLCDVDQGQTPFPRSQGGGHPFHGHIRAATGNHLCGRDVGTTGFDGDVQVLISVEPFFQGDVIARKLGLGDPFQLQGQIIRRIGAARGQDRCGHQCRR